MISGVVSALSLSGIVNTFFRATGRSSLTQITRVIAPLITVTSSFFFLHFRSGFEFVLAIACWLLGVLFFAGSFRENPTTQTTLSKPEANRFQSATKYRAATASSSALFFALCCYLYTPARGWIPLTLAILMCCYFRQIRGAKWQFAIAVSVFTLLLVPYFVTTISHPEIGLGRLQVMGISSWGDLYRKLDGQFITRALEVVCTLVLALVEWASRV